MDSPASPFRSRVSPARPDTVQPPDAPSPSLPPPPPPRDRDSRRQWPIALVSLALVVVAVFCMVRPGPFLRMTFQDHWRARSAELVEGNLKTNIVAFASLSALKGGIHMIEGSSIGIGVDLQVGDLVQPACDYIDFVWQAFLWAFLVLGAYQILLQTELLEIGVYLFAAGLLLSPAFALRGERARRLRWWSARLALTGALVFYGIPVSLLLADTLSRRYLDPFKAQQLERMAQVERDFERSRLEFLEIRNDLSLLAPRQSLESAYTSLSRIVRSASDLITTNAWGFLFYILVTLIEIVVLPLLTALALWHMARLALGLSRSVPRSSRRPWPARRRRPSPSISEDAQGAPPAMEV